MHSVQQRKSIRFHPDPLAVAHLDIARDNTEFEPTMVGLIADEAHQGCGLVLKTFVGLKEGLVLRVRVGVMPPLVATVRWIRPLDHVLVRVGLEFLE